MPPVAAMMMSRERKSLLFASQQEQIDSLLHQAGGIRDWRGFDCDL